MQDITLFLPHMDDELVHCYWLTKKYGKRIKKVVYITNSSVELPEPTIPTENYVDQRKGESVRFLRKFTNALIKHIYFLDYPDNNLSTFYSSEKLLKKLEPHLEDKNIWVVPNPHDIHPDHAFAGRMLVANKKSNLVIFGLISHIDPKSSLLFHAKYFRVEGNSTLKDKMKKLKTFYPSQMQNLMQTNFDLASDEFYIDLYNNAGLFEANNGQPTIQNSR